LFAAGLLARLLAHLPGPVLWVLRRHDLFAPGLAMAGLDPDRLLLVEAGKQVLAVMEEGLRHAGLAAVLGELPATPSLTQSRRLHLATEQGGGLGLLLRRDATANAPPTAALTSWRVTPLPAPPPLPHAPATPGLGRARWRLELTRCRGGGSGTWIVEACDATGHLALAAQPADGPAAAERRRSA
jgi:protein ImuA